MDIKPPWFVCKYSEICSSFSVCLNEDCTHSLTISTWCNPGIKHIWEW